MELISGLRSDGGGRVVGRYASPCSWKLQPLWSAGMGMGTNGIAKVGGDPDSEVGAEWIEPE